MAMRSDEFLKGLDPERNKFGLKAGLEYWLRLNEQGLMDTGFGDHRKEFEAELVKYST